MAFRHLIFFKKSGGLMNKSVDSTATDTFKVAALQMVSGTDLQENLNEAERLIAQAAELGAQLIALPEFFCLMGREDQDKVKIAEDFGQGQIQSNLADWARKYNAYIVAGSVPLRSPEQIGRAHV